MKKTFYILIPTLLLTLVSIYAWPRDKDPTKNSSKEIKTNLRSVILTNGMPEQKLIAELGEPKGIISGGSKKTLLYDGVQIQTVNGYVINLPPDIIDQLEIGKKEAAQSKAFMAKQKKKGLILHKGRWTTPAEKGQVQTTKKQKKAKAKPFVMRGKDNYPVDHSHYIHRGHVTVIDFYADWCGPCRALAPRLNQLLQSHSGVILEKVNIVNWGSSVAERYNVTSVPNVRVFDRNGNMMGPPTSNLQNIDTYIRKAKKQ